MADETKETSMTQELYQMYQDMCQHWGITSFSDFEKIDRSGDVLDDMGTLHAIAQMMLYNIKDYSPDRISAARKMVEEYHTMALALLDEYDQVEENKEQRQGILGKLKELFSIFKTKEKKYKTEGGIKYSASDYLYVEDPDKPSTWKLRVAEGESGNVTVAQLGRAAASFSEGGFRGNKVELPSGKVASIKSKLRGLYSKLGVEDSEIPDSIKKEAPFMLFKDANGGWRWFARYSNNYRDNDRPAEIISKESHKTFVDMVDRGEVPMPELWHWHIPGTKWGQADWVAYDEDAGVAMASGTVLPGHEKEAELLSQLDTELGVSHGMPAKSVKRDESDSTIIVGHITREISDLPLWAAANKLTSFSVLKETDMAIPDQKKQFLKGIGFSDETISEIEQGNSALAKFAKENDIEAKEAPVDVPESPEKAKKPETTEGDKMDEDDEEGEKPAAKKEAPVETTQYVTAQEVTDAVMQITTALVDQIKSLSDKVETLVKEREDEKKEATDNPVVPTASLAAMIAKQFSAIGSEEAAVRKNSTLAKSGPSETPAEDPKPIVDTNNPLLDGVISGIIGRSK